MKKRAWISILLLMLLLVGCGGKEHKEETEYLVYNVDKDENKVGSYTIKTEETETKPLLQVLFSALQQKPEKAGDKSAIPTGVELIGFSLHGNQLSLNFSIEYLSMNSIQEVLSRAAIVRTLCQVEEVEFVTFRVEGEPLTNAGGYPVGLMSKDQFVDNAGNEINAYEKAELQLYFADETGSFLEPHTVECVYNSNISLDKLVVEQLIKGPQKGESADNGFATIGHDTQILSVTTQDGVCYVNLSKGFLVRRGNVTPEVAVYSLVNSLVELQGVNRVQLSVEGDDQLNYMESVPLSQSFERNLEIIKNAQ